MAIAGLLLTATLVSEDLPFVGTYQAGDEWGALADRTRRTILERLAEGPCAVGELARELPISRPAVSQHLKVLKDAGLVGDRAVGTRRIYHLDPAGISVLRSQLDRFWAQALTAYKDAVEQPAGEVMTQTHAESVHKQVVVNAGVERAFSLFIERFDAIKPREHNIMAVPIAETVFEPRVGGNIYDRGVDGTECRWARVLAYEPPSRVVFSWDINGHWQIETTRPRPARWRSGSSPNPPIAPGSRSSTATSSATARVGKRSATVSNTTPGGRSTCSATVAPSTVSSTDGTDHDQHRRRPPTEAGVRLSSPTRPASPSGRRRRQRPHGR